jgi:Glycosyltransferases, probably involved in cell wall biogenesis
LVPAYNCALYIREALQSLLVQTYRDFEIIVVDDGSTDGTWDVLAEYRHDVRAIRQNNRGVSTARNEALHRAKGELIALLDADDVYLPGKLESQVRALDQHPEAGFMSGDVVMFTNEGEVLGTILPRRMPIFKEWMAANEHGGVSVGYIYREMLNGMVVPGGSSPMIRRACLEVIGGYDPALRAGAEDYDLNLRLAQRYPVILLDEILYRYRWYETSSSGAFGNRIAQWVRLHSEVRKTHFRALPENLPKEAWDALCRYYWDTLTLERMEETRLLFRPCLSHQHRKAKATAYFLGSYLPAPARRFCRTARAVQLRVARCLRERTTRRKRPAQ